MILGLLFVLFGIMNPVIAKLTPWLLEAMADSLAESRMIITDVKVSAMDSWVQFYKNISRGLIAFVLPESSIFTKEYTSGTLVLSLTKGLERYMVAISKALALTVLWTLSYWLCFGITYGYNAYFRDNSIAQNLVFSVVYWWLFEMLSLRNLHKLTPKILCAFVLRFDVYEKEEKFSRKCGNYIEIHYTFQPKPLATFKTAVSTIAVLPIPFTPLRTTGKPPSVVFSFA